MGKFKIDKIDYSELPKISLYCILNGIIELFYHKGSFLCVKVDVYLVDVS